MIIMDVTHLTNITDLDQDSRPLTRFTPRTALEVGTQYSRVESNRTHTFELTARYARQLTRWENADQVGVCPDSAVCLMIVKVLVDIACLDYLL